MRELFALLFALAAISLATPSAAQIGNSGIWNPIRLPPIPSAPPPPVLNEAKPEERKLIRVLYTDLLSKSDDDLAVLSEMKNPCSEIDCHSLPADTVVHFAKSVHDQNVAHADAIIKQQQAWASIISCSVSFFALLLSGASFVRAGRTKTQDAKPVAPEVVAERDSNSEAQLDAIGLRGTSDDLPAL